MKREGEDLEDESKNSSLFKKEPTESKENIRKKKRVKFGKLHLEVRPSW